MSAGEPLKGVELALTLSPPSSSAVDLAFASAGGLSGEDGLFLVQYVAKYEVRRSILSLVLGRRRHPFGHGWLLLRVEGRLAAVVKLDISDWKEDGSLNSLSDVSLEQTD